jgi:hypothetical protein
MYQQAWNVRVLGMVVIFGFSLASLFPLLMPERWEQRYSHKRWSETQELALSL